MGGGRGTPPVPLPAPSPTPRQQGPGQAVLGPARPREPRCATSCRAQPCQALLPASRLAPHNVPRAPRHPPSCTLHPAAVPRSLQRGRPPPPAPLAAPHTLGANPGWRTKAASRLPSPGCVGKPGAAQCPQFSHPHLCPALPGSPVPTGGSTPAPHGTAPSIRHSPRAGLEPLCGTCVCTHLLPGLI